MRCLLQVKYLSSAIYSLSLPVLNQLAFSRTTSLTLLSSLRPRKTG